VHLPLRARLIVGPLLALAWAIAVTGGVGAHALAVASNPSPGATLASAPSQVTITFGEQPDPKLSSIRVLDANGAAVTSGPTTTVSGKPVELTVPVGSLANGVYTVAWRTVSAVDGHLASGSFAFGVGVTPSAGGATATVSGSSGNATVASIAGRWLLYLGLLLLLGVSFFGLAIAPLARLVWRLVLPVAWLIAAVGTVTVVGLQLADAGVALDQLFGTSFGPNVLERGIPVIAAGLVLLAVESGRLRLGPGLTILAIAATAGLLADVLTSHAAAGNSPALDTAVQALHVLSVGLWLGGLVGLLLTLRGQAGDASARAAGRFSRLATVGIAAVAVTGVVRAVEEVGTLDQLVNSDFGRLVIAKSALLGIIALLGAVNHFRNVRAAGHELRGLRRFGSVELLVAATVLLLSATLVNLAPPAEVSAASGGSGPAAPAAKPVVVAGSDFGTSVRLRLLVGPGTPGFNTFTASVTDYDTGAPVPADKVTLQFADVDRSDIGGSRLDLPRQPDGTFSATGGNLSLAGAWQISALVVNGTNSVTVPLTLVTNPAPAQVDTNAVAGLPTIFTFHLSAGRSVQVYLDPGTPGANEVHATFFDQTGTELPVQTVTMTIGPVGGPQSLLTPRQLEPGHFVADTTLAAGSDTVSIAGPAPNGDELVAQLTVPVAK
jgi:copper transport protein